MGGMAAAVASGMPKQRIEESAARKQARIDSSSDVIVGVNKFKPAAGREQPLPDIRTIDNQAVIDAQLAKLETLRASRDETRVAAALRALTDSASAWDSSEGGNLMGLAIEAARKPAGLAHCRSESHRVDWCTLRMCAVSASRVPRQAPRPQSVRSPMRSSVSGVDTRRPSTCRAAHTLTSMAATPTRLTRLSHWRPTSRRRQHNDRSIALRQGMA